MYTVLASLGAGQVVSVNVEVKMKEDDIYVGAQRWNLSLMECQMS